MRNNRKYLNAIIDFRSPKSITDIRSWFSHVNQVSCAFSVPERMLLFPELLNPRNQVSNDYLQSLCEEPMMLLTGEIDDRVRIFDRDGPTCLATDWPKSGFSICLPQKLTILNISHSVFALVGRSPLMTADSPIQQNHSSHQQRANLPHRGYVRGRRFSRPPRYTLARTDRKLLPSSETTSITSNDTSEFGFSRSPFINPQAKCLVPLNEDCPYPGWLLYFPTHAYDANGKPKIYTKVFLKFLLGCLEHANSDTTLYDNNYNQQIDWFQVESQGAVLLDYSTLCQSLLLEEQLPEFKALLNNDLDGGALCAEQCELVIQALGLAIHTICYNAVYKDNKNHFFEGHTSTNVRAKDNIPSYIVCRIINHNPVTPLRKIRAHHLGRFISVKGVIVRLGDIEPVCRRLVFECLQCHGKQTLVLPADGRYSTTSRCLTRGCRSRCFEPLLNHSDTITADTQLITIQEVCEEDTEDPDDQDRPTLSSTVGRNSRSLTCRLQLDLVDSSLPGDLVHLFGVLSLLNAEGLGPSFEKVSDGTGTSARSPMFNFVLEVNSVIRITGVGGGQNAATRTVNHCAQSTGLHQSPANNPGLLVITAASTEDSHQEGQLPNETAHQLRFDQAVSGLDGDFSLKELYAIREISEQPELFRLLVASLCPSICGRGLVKAGLLLALFGGSQSQNRRRRLKPDPEIEDSFGVLRREDDLNSPDADDCDFSYRITGAKTHSSPSGQTDTCTEVAQDCDEADGHDVLDSSNDFNPQRRSSSHVLVIGDPGLGKSQMLRAAASLAPRVVYVCGNTASAAGLTVSTMRESSAGFGGARGATGGFGLEAGALILADQGCCCVDEFDKLACDPAVLLEAMEQQTISVARGGLVANLPARTALLAAANPIGGHYNPSRRLEENVRISPALLSRFDLIFVLLDRPDETADRLLSEHVTAVHTGQWRPSSFVCTQSSSQSTGPVRSQLRDGRNGKGFTEWLEFGRREERLNYLPPALLRKYILYARKYVMPRLSHAAAMTLRDFYLELRRSRQLPDGFPVTMRQLESLIRLSEARARAELREEVTREDAVDVCELMRVTGLGSRGSLEGNGNTSLSDAVIAQSLVRGTTRRSVSATGPAAANKLLIGLRITSQRANSNTFTRSEISTLATGLGFPKAAVDALIERLNDAGTLLKQSPNLYRLI